MMLVGLLQISAPATWLFYNFDNLTLGVRDSRAGALQISSAFRTEAPNGGQPDQCEALAREYLGEPVTEFNRRIKGDDALGAAFLVSDDSMGRLWYALRDGQLIIASYRPNPGPNRKDLVNVEIEEAQEIVWSCRWVPAPES